MAAKWVRTEGDRVATGADLDKHQGEIVAARYRSMSDRSMSARVWIVRARSEILHGLERFLPGLRSFLHGIQRFSSVWNGFCSGRSDRSSMRFEGSSPLRWICSRATAMRLETSMVGISARLLGLAKFLTLLVADASYELVAKETRAGRVGAGDPWRDADTKSKNFCERSRRRATCGDLASRDFREGRGSQCGKS